jgi:hypothetical protein
MTEKEKAKELIGIFDIDKAFLFVKKHLEEVESWMVDSCVGESYPFSYWSKVKDEILNYKNED